MFRKMVKERVEKIGNIGDKFGKRVRWLFSKPLIMLGIAVVVGFVGFFCFLFCFLYGVFYKEEKND